MSAFYEWWRTRGFEIYAEGPFLESSELKSACNESWNAALDRVAKQLRDADATLPAPPVTGTIEGSMLTGLCIALAVVEDTRAAREQS